ncbi:Leucine-rich repeat serine/threonine-protein kinase 2, partial [Ceratobasidium sp. 392]
MGIIHGDIRARNVLISDDGVAKITGFGSSVLEQDTPERHQFFQFATRWAAPERLFDDERSWPPSFQFPARNKLAEQFADDKRPWVPSWPTVKSDVWSLALTVLEAMSNTRPYADLSELRVIYAVAEQKQTPARPAKFISVKPG